MNQHTPTAAQDTERYATPNGQTVVAIPAGTDLNYPAFPTEHADLLEELIDQIQPIDFEALAFPQAAELKAKIERLEAQIKNPDGSYDTTKTGEMQEWKQACKDLDALKITIRHLLILSVENLLHVAQTRNWGLCKNLDFIYLYNGTHWRDIDKELFQKFLGEASEKMGVAKFSARYYQFREQLFKQFIATAYLPTPTPPRDSVMINLMNGTFEVTPAGTVLRPFNREDFLTYQLPFEYDPGAKAPTFQTYLDRVLPDEDKSRQTILAEYLAYVFIRPETLKLEKTLILYGTGANGKSVFFEIVNALLGPENVSSYSLQSLTDENGYFRAKLANKLVNYASEINGRLETSIFKQLVSGEPVGARLPYGQPFTLTQYAKLIFNCNELPRDVEHTEAYFRRFLIIPFDVTIPEAEQDKQLAKKIIDNELSGVFNWVLAGLARLLKNKRFTDCDAVTRSSAAYKKQSDTVLQFLEEHAYQADANDYTLAKTLYSEYRTFCIEDGFKPLNKSNFLRRLEAAGIFTARRNLGVVAFVAKTHFGN